MQHGGCGVVTFVDLPDGTRAAVKQLHAGGNPGMTSTFVHEVSSLELLPPHSNVITLLGHCWQCVGQYAMVFEHAPDGDLERAGAQRLISSPSQAAAVLADAGRGSAHLHAHDIAHADVKEANMLLWLHGGEVTAKLADLGLCSALQGQQFVSSGAGTPGYRAPEVKAQTLCLASDVYSFAVTIGRALLNLEPRALLNMAQRIKPHLSNEANDRMLHVIRKRVAEKFGLIKLANSDVVDRIAMLCMTAVDSDITKRPSLAVVIAALHAVAHVK